MDINYFKSINRLNAKAISLLTEEFYRNNNLNVCVSSGSSPVQLYQDFVNVVNEENLDVEEMVVTKLDEWCDVAKTDDVSCEKFIQDNLIKPLGIKNYVSFDPEASNYDEECERVENELDNCPIDVCILGFGMNGHLGLNEPDQKFTLKTHVSELSQTTRSHDMIVKRDVTRGMTIGINQIMNSKKVILIVKGKRKRRAFQEFLEDFVNPFIPASILKLHANCDVLVFEPDVSSIVIDNLESIKKY